MSGYLTFAFAADEAGAIAQCREWLTDPARQNSVYDAMLMAFRWGHGAGARDPSTVLAAIPELASRVDSNVLSGWAKTNPTGAAEFIAQRAAAGNPVPNLADEGVLAEIVIAQPEWTAAWLTGLSDVTLQKEAANTLAANWAAFDPAGAAGWLTSLPEGEVRTAGEAGFARRNESKPDPFNKED